MVSNTDKSGAHKDSLSFLFLNVVLDDAFSIEKLDEHSYQVGVHVSDVAYFIKPHSALDKEARTRGVRVDLIHTHVPLVPEIMTEKLTNLIPNHTR
jgi:protein SSD1